MADGKSAAPSPIPYPPSPARSALVQLALALRAGVIDIYHLGFGVEIEHLGALLAWADAGGLHAAEWQLRLAAERGRVDVGHARFDLVDIAEHTRYIACVDA